jgi:predicted nucleic acid-binding protein
MGVEDGSIILLDTNSFIYYFEDNKIFADMLEIIFTRIQDGKLTAYMSQDRHRLATILTSKLDFVS